jgi:hypothetical protein
MPLTLQTARERLSKSIELGISASDTRSIERINEAQRRLHSQAIYLGTLQSYVVKVDTLTNIFQKPTALESVARVSRYTGASLGPNETSRFLSNGPDVFVSDPTTLLPIAFISGSPNSYKLLDKTLPVKEVEVVGKAVLVEATSNSQNLLIDDLDALKLMILALYREENNQLEQAKAFNDLAIKYLRDKTDSAVNVAQKIQHQSFSESSPYGTLGYVRSRLIREMPDLSRLNDSELTTLINSSQESAVAQYNFLSRQDPDASSKFHFQEVFLDSSPLAVPSYEVNRLLVLSSQTKKSDESAVLKKSAFELIERDFNEQVISRRKSVYNSELLTSPAGSLAHVSSKLALDVPSLLEKPVQQIRRSVSQAEEVLINSGRWSGTIDLLECQITDDEGEYPLPEYADAVLLANVADKPISIYDRDYDFHENGPGWNRSGNGSSGVSIAIDRGFVEEPQQLDNENSNLVLTTDSAAQPPALFSYQLLSPVNAILSSGYNNRVFKVLPEQTVSYDLGKGFPNFLSSFKLFGPDSLKIDSKSGRLTGKVPSEIVSIAGDSTTLTWPLNKDFKLYVVEVKKDSSRVFFQETGANQVQVSGITTGNSYTFTVHGKSNSTKIPNTLLYSGSWPQNASGSGIISNYHLRINAASPKSKRIKIYLRGVSKDQIVRFIYKLKPKVYTNPKDLMLLDHYTALKEASLAILSGDQEQFSSRMAIAKDLLNQQLKERRGGRIIRPSVQLDAWAIGAIDPRQ